MCLRKDFDTFGLYKRLADHIHYWSHILVGNLAVHQQSLVDTSMLADRRLLDKCYDFHTGSAHMGLMVAKLQLKIIINKYEFEMKKKNIYFPSILTYFWFWSASIEWIALIISNTCTNWHVINNLTFGIIATHARTWISTMLTNASHSAGAI